MAGDVLKDVLARPDCRKLLADQDGLIHRNQLKTFGVSGAELRRAELSGALKAHLPKIYEIETAAHRTRQVIRGAAMWLPKAVVSHEAAVVLHGLDGVRSCPVTLSLSNVWVARRRGIHIHRRPKIDPADITLVDGMRVTAVERTLLDVANVLGEEKLAWAVDHAWRLKLTTPAQLRARVEAERRRGAKQLPALQRVLDQSELRGRALDSAFEVWWWRVGERFGLPRPEVQVPFTYEDYDGRIDFFYRREGLVIETMGRRFHEAASTREKDSRRMCWLTALGYSVMPITWSMLEDEIEQTVREVRQALAVRALKEKRRWRQTAAIAPSVPEPAVLQ